MDRIKRLSFEVLGTHKSKFGQSFDENKKTLDSVTVIRSKGLKNEIAGYITKFLKKEAREQKAKQDQIETAKLEKEREGQVEVEIVEEKPQNVPETQESETESTLPTESPNSEDSSESEESSDSVKETS